MLQEQELVRDGDTRAIALTAWALANAVIRQIRSFGSDPRSSSAFAKLAGVVVRLGQNDQQPKRGS